MAASSLSVTREDSRGVNTGHADLIVFIACDGGAATQHIWRRDPTIFQFRDTTHQNNFLRVSVIGPEEDMSDYETLLVDPFDPEKYSPIALRSWMSGEWCFRRMHSAEDLVNIDRTRKSFDTVILFSKTHPNVWFKCDKWKANPRSSQFVRRHLETASVRA